MCLLPYFVVYNLLTQLEESIGCSVVERGSASSV